MEPALELHGVTVAYRLPQIKPRKLKSLPAAVLPRRVRHEALYALRDVSFSVARGESVAIVGANGAGKSTLLRLLARTFAPTRGRVVARGRVAPLIDLGSGLDLGAPARENVVLYGALLGERPSALRPQVEEILEWAGLSDYADVPVGAFSSGMIARLAFAVATSGAPDVLLIDEVLGVGDSAFLAQSSQRLHDLIAAGCAVVVVSHAPELLRPIASRGVLLERGRVVLDAPLEEVIEQHLQAEPAPIVVDHP